MQRNVFLFGGLMVSANSTRSGTRVSGSALNRLAAGSGTAQRNLRLALVVIAAAQLMVTLDVTIVNVALRHIQVALGFSDTNLEWVVNAYALAFGGLLLLGGRSGDLLGRRRIFVCGIALFTLASLAGGFAPDQAWLLTARAVQGVGAALAAPTALALIATTFPAGEQRNRAMGVYAAMTACGGAVGLVAGGILVTYTSWRWVLFVNVPIGAAIVLLAGRALPESARIAGRLDLPGAITGSLAIASLVYGLSNAATDEHGVSHWGDTNVVFALVAAGVLLAVFFVIEARSDHPLVPGRVLRSRDRSGDYVISLCAGLVIFSTFFFLTLFIQQVWGYSPMRTGLAYLPMIVLMLLAAAAASHLVSRIGARPLLLGGAGLASVAMLWLSRLTEHSSYAGGLLGPSMMFGLGLGSLFVAMSLIGLEHVTEADHGVASSLLSTGRQVGGSVGLAVLGTVAWTAVSGSVRSQTTAAAGHMAVLARSMPPARAAKAIASWRTAAINHAIASGFARAYLVAAGVALLALLITVIVIRTRREDLADVVS
jgi:EmrB/QacA subfamily drug resistance transporter